MEVKIIHFSDPKSNRTNTILDEKCCYFLFNKHYIPLSGFSSLYKRSLAKSKILSFCKFKNRKYKRLSQLWCFLEFSEQLNTHFNAIFHVQYLKGTAARLITLKQNIKYHCKRKLALFWVWYFFAFLIWIFDSFNFHVWSMILSKFVDNSPLMKIKYLMIIIGA